MILGRPRRRPSSIDYKSARWYRPFQVSRRIDVLLSVSSTPTSRPSSSGSINAGNVDRLEFLWGVSRGFFRVILRLVVNGRGRLLDTSYLHPHPHLARPSPRLSETKWIFLLIYLIYLPRPLLCYCMNENSKQPSVSMWRLSRIRISTFKSGI